MINIYPLDFNIGMTDVYMYEISISSFFPIETKEHQNKIIK